MRRSVAVVAGGAALTLMAGAFVQAADGPTTLDRTIVATGPKELAYGPGDKRVTRRLQWDGGTGKGRPLGGFKHVSDIHVVDEESPGRVEYFDACGSDFNGAYRVQEALSTQIGNSMLKRLNKISSGPATGVPLDFVISTGDNVDNNQRNETRWFIDLLDGATIDPNSGGSDYDGYTTEQFSGALDDEDLKRAQEAFDAVGTKSPWYAVLGNHDGLVQGNVPANPSFEAFAVGGSKVFSSIEGYEDCPEGTDFPSIAGAIERAFATSARPVPPDPDRHFLSKDELIAEYFETSGKPVGHGLGSAPKVAGKRQGYYTFKVAPRVLGISLDTIAHDGGGPNGHIPDSQFRWLERKLKRNSTRFYKDGRRRFNRAGKDKLIVLFSHHSSVTLNNPPGGGGDDPYHCFRTSDAPNCELGAGLYGLIRRFPNVVAWVNGHEHNNAVRPYPRGPKQRNRARGFWEINTAAHIDWPQQSRVIELAYKPGKGAKDNLFIYATVVDHAASPVVPDPETVPVEDYLAALGRVEAYHDACERSGQAKCEAPGRPRDRNVKLVMKSPFDLGH